MTLPKTFSLAPKNFNNFDTMSFEANRTRNTNSSLPYQEQQHHQAAQNSQQQILSMLNPSHSTTSSLSSIPNATNTDKNISILEANSPLSQLTPKNQVPQFLMECIMPDIYLTKDFISWNGDKLRANGFTHIIIIDKHIQELYYPNQQPDIFKLCSVNNEIAVNLRNNDTSASLTAFDYYCPPPTATRHLNFGKEFEVIDLNFGEKSYLTTVLPNCYRAVKFINKALQAGGKILVIDCNGGEQKCLTIIVAYLMYKYNISFSNAFARLKEFYNKADLDRFYTSQLYEYEPILQVQRAQSRGHSCSRKLHSAILKRKKNPDDYDAALDNNIACSGISTASSSSCYVYTNSSTNATTASELLNNCNPLNSFDSTKMEGQNIKPPNPHSHSMIPDNQNNHTFTRFMNGMPSSITTGGWYNWDDYAME